MFAGGIIFNAVGGFTRYLYGNLIRWLKLSNRPHFSLREYLNGPDQVNDEVFERGGHLIVNRAVGFITILIVLMLIWKIEALIRITFYEGY